MGMNEKGRLGGGRDFFKEYEMLVLLGSGSFGEVWVCREKRTGRSFACKLMEKGCLSGSGTADDKQRRLDLLREIAVLKMFQGRHENIVQLHQVMEGEMTVQLVMELCKGGDLFDLLCKNDKLPEAAARHVFAQLASALAFCHSKGVLHRDIKPENILFDSSASSLYEYTRASDPPPPTKAKLADFGLSLILGPSGAATGFCGSRFYTAPEMVRGRSYGTPADVWSMGVVLCVMLTARLPFAGETSDDQDGLRKAILKGKVGFHQPEWEGVSQAAKDLVHLMLEVNPEKRPKSWEILVHPWVAEAASEQPPKLSSVEQGKRVEGFGVASSVSGRDEHASNDRVTAGSRTLPRPLTPATSSGTPSASHSPSTGSGSSSSRSVSRPSTAGGSVSSSKRASGTPGSGPFPDPNFEGRVYGGGGTKPVYGSSSKSVYGSSQPWATGSVEEQRGRGGGWDHPREGGMHPKGLTGRAVSGSTEGLEGLATAALSSSTSREEEDLPSPLSHSHLPVLETSIPAEKIPFRPSHSHLPVLETGMAEKEIPSPSFPSHPAALETGMPAVHVFPGRMTQGVSDSGCGGGGGGVAQGPAEQTLHNGEGEQEYALGAPEGTHLYQSLTLDTPEGTPVHQSLTLGTPDVTPLRHSLALGSQEGSLARSVSSPPRTENVSATDGVLRTPSPMGGGWVTGSGGPAEDQGDWRGGSGAEVVRQEDWKGGNGVEVVLKEGAVMAGNEDRTVTRGMMSVRKVLRRSRKGEADVSGEVSVPMDSTPGTPDVSVEGGNGDAGGVPVVTAVSSTLFGGRRRSAAQAGRSHSELAPSSSVYG